MRRDFIALSRWSAEERRKYLDELFDGPELPMFAESAEEMDPRLVEALTFLKYDGETPESLAESCKHLGNKSFKVLFAVALDYFDIACYICCEGSAPPQVVVHLQRPMESLTLS